MNVIWLVSIVITICSYPGKLVLVTYSIFIILTVMCIYTFTPITYKYIAGDASPQKSVSKAMEGLKNGLPSKMGLNRPMGLTKYFW